MLGNLAPDIGQGEGTFPVKTIRVLSFAPDLESPYEYSETPPSISEEAQAAVLGIMDMLSEDEGSSSEDEGSGDESEHI